MTASCIHCPRPISSPDHHLCRIHEEARAQRVNVIRLRIAKRFRLRLAEAPWIAQPSRHAWMSDLLAAKAQTGRAA